MVPLSAWLVCVWWLVALMTPLQSPQTSKAKMATPQPMSQGRLGFAG
jgi:hypothetical protein